MKRVILTAFLLGLCADLFGKIITVDANGGGDYETIQAATAASTTQAGDTILVMPGEYFCTATTGVITVSKKLFIIGSGYAPVANGGTRIVDVKGDGIFDLQGTSDGTHISGFRMEAKGKAVNLQSGADKVVIENNFLILSSNQTYIIYINTAQTDTIRSNILIYSGTDSWYKGYGIYLSSTTNVVVCNNLLSNLSYAFSDQNNCTNTKVLNNIFLHLGSYYYNGIYLYGSSIFAANILMNSSDNYCGIYDASSGNAAISNNCFFNLTGGNQGSKGVSPVEADPNFKNFSSNDVFNATSLEDKEYDFHLNTTSPCIDAGITGSAYLDKDGSRNDIGMYGGPYPFNNDLGIPTIPEVISILVTPTSVSPSGTITVKATGRIGSGPGSKSLSASPSSSSPSPVSSPAAIEGEKRVSAPTGTSPKAKSQTK